MRVTGPWGFAQTVSGSSRAQQRRFPRGARAASPVCGPRLCNTVDVTVTGLALAERMSRGHVLTFGFTARRVGRADIIIEGNVCQSHEKYLRVTE
jgi:hypothetical protein